MSIYLRTLRLLISKQQKFKTVIHLSVHGSSGFGLLLYYLEELTFLVSKHQIESVQNGFSLNCGVIILNVHEFSNLVATTKTIGKQKTADD